MCYLRGDIRLLLMKIRKARFFCGLFFIRPYRLLFQLAASVTTVYALNSGGVSMCFLTAGKYTRISVIKISFQKYTNFLLPAKTGKYRNRLMKLDDRVSKRLH
jgi:hypothetical protein